MAKIRIRDKKLANQIPKKMIAGRKKMKLYKISLGISILSNAVLAYFLYF